MERPVCLSLIVAIADNGVIGQKGGLPWRLRSDLRRFRKLTMGHPLIMGRRTFASIGKALDGRDSIVVTRGEDRAPMAGVFFIASFEDALRLAEQKAYSRGVSEIFVIGGAKIFALALPLASRIYLTRVHTAPAGDVRWEPRLDVDWKAVSREERPAGAGDEFPVTDLVLERA